MDTHIKQMLRMQAWERAKGEMRSMLYTFYDSDGASEKLKEAMEIFIDVVEDNGLHE